jgi:hypothetical protein
MTDKDAIKRFLTALANDDYVQADKEFPEVMRVAAERSINKRKPQVIDSINAEANKLAIGK